MTVRDRYHSPPRAANVVLQPARLAAPKGYANGIKARGEIVFVGGMVGWDAQEQLSAGFRRRRRGRL